MNITAKAPPHIASIWSDTGLAAALRHLATQYGWEQASEKLLAAYQRNRRAVERYSNAVVRHTIKVKIASGHASFTRDFDGVPHVALDYGPGKCSSSFVRA